MSPSGPVELVKAADIKIIAALGDSLTVGVLLLFAYVGKCTEIFMTSVPALTIQSIINSLKACGILQAVYPHASFVYAVGVC